MNSLRLIGNIRSNMLYFLTNYKNAIAHPTSQTNQRKESKHLQTTSYVDILLLEIKRGVCLQCNILYPTLVLNTFEYITM